MQVVDGARKRPDSEMPRLKRFLRGTFLTWLPLVAIESAAGGVLTAKTLGVNHVGSFFGGTLLFFGVVALPSLFIVATYVLTEAFVQRRGITGALQRIALAIGSAILVIGLVIGVKLLTMDDPIPWWRIRMKYQSWLLGALFLSPVLVLIRGRVK